MEKVIFEETPRRTTLWDRITRIWFRIKMNYRREEEWRKAQKNWNERVKHQPLLRL